MKKLIYGFLCLSISIGMASCDMENESDSAEHAEEQNKEQFDEKWEQDTEFAVAAASGGLMEVRLGEIAQQNAASAEVKQFGQTMVEDHSKANDELKMMARLKDIEIPTIPGEEQQEEINKLLKKNGQEFDNAYMELMVKDHKEDIEKFKKQAQEGKDPELRKWAAEKVPILEMHLDMAQQMHDRMNSK